VKVDALQNLDVFLVGCTISANQLEVLILWVKPKLVKKLAGQCVTLVEPKNPDLTITVELPADLAPMYTYAQMKRIDL